MTAPSFHRATTRDHRRTRRLLRDAAMLLTLAVSLLAPSSTATAACTFGGTLDARAGLSPNQRSIVLLEDRDPANFPIAAAADGLIAHAGLSPTQRSIVLLEAEDPGNYPATIATTSGFEAHAGLSPSQRAIVLLEGRDPANVPATAAVC